MNNTCSSHGNNYVYKAFILLLLIVFLSISGYVYYRSLKSIKHNELEGR